MSGWLVTLLGCLGFGALIDRSLFGAPGRGLIERIGRWLMFGLGPIRASGRDLQAIRHQNLTYIVESLEGQRGQLNSFYKAVGLSQHKCGEFINNPFSPIPERIVRKAEKFLHKPQRWMDEQHVEADPLCAAFPEDMRRIMEIYSGLDEDKRKLLARMVEVFAA